MFGRRSDGKRIKIKGAINRMMPMLLKTREGSTNFFLFNQSVAPMDEFIKAKQAEGINYSYRDICIATLVRIFAKYPRFNRFFMGDRLYQRNHIEVAMVVHKSLRKGDEEVVVKIRLTGLETISEIKQKMDAATEEAIKASELDFFDKMPQWLLRIVARLIRLLDRWGILPKAFLNMSPFHSSIFFSDLKSIRMNYAYHHLYNFGNCGFFACLGKEQKQAAVDDETDTVHAEKAISLGISMDERFVDGLYYGHMVKGVNRTIANLEYLEQPLSPDEILTPPDMPKLKRAKPKAHKTK